MFQSSPSQQSQFSYRSFSIFSQLIQLQQSATNTSSHISPSIKQMEEEFTKNSSSKYDNSLFNFLKTKALSSSSDPIGHKDHFNSPLTQSFKNFLNSFSQTKVRISNLDNLVQNLNQCKFFIAEKRRLYSLKQQMARKQLKHKGKNLNLYSSEYKPVGNEQISYKAFVIYGKAVNVQKQKKNRLNTQSQVQLIPTSAQDSSAKQQTISELQFCMTHMYEQQKLPYIKSQPHQLQDLLLTHYLEDSSLKPILTTHQVYRLFVPIQGAILLVVPEDLIQPVKQQIPFIIKNTVLHVYMDNYKVLCKIVSKQSFFKSTKFRGIYFVQEGQVQTKSGRVVARGWVINGKCKSITQAWKFTKIMAFFKYVLDNQNIWKQFINDLKLNGQWPIKISDVLNLDETAFEQIMGQQSPGFKLNPGNPRQKRLKFPPISSRLSKSFDITKLTQIQKMRHYDEKMNHLHELKQQMLKRKMQHGAKRNSLHMESQAANEASQRQMNKRIHIISQKMNLPQKGLKTDVSRSTILRPGESSANILITGIVQKLKSIHEGSARNSLQKTVHGQSKSKIMEIGRSRTKILGLKRYEQIIKSQKNHLYKGKNFYN